MREGGDAQADSRAPPPRRERRGFTRRRWPTRRVAERARRARRRARRGRPPARVGVELVGGRRGEREHVHARAPTRPTRAAGERRGRVVRADDERGPPRLEQLHGRYAAEYTSYASTPGLSSRCFGAVERKRSSAGYAHGRGARTRRGARPRRARARTRAHGAAPPRRPRPSPRARRRRAARDARRRVPRRARRAARPSRRDALVQAERHVARRAARAHRRRRACR